MPDPIPSRWLAPILRPLARLAISRGWLFPQVSEDLRRAFLEAAQDEAGGSATDSKLSILTGLQRRDVARLRSADVSHAKHDRQPLAEIISLWANDPDTPHRDLPANGPPPSFSDIAQRVRKDVHPRTFLNRLIDLGAVREVDGRLTLLTRTYQPDRGSDDQMDYLSANVGDHLSTAVGNVVDGTDRLDVSVHYTGLSAEAAQRLEDHWTTKQRALAEELDAMARALPAADNGAERFRAGAYFFREGSKT